jgi:hypothetical protein
VFLFTLAVLTMSAGAPALPDPKVETRSGQLRLTLSISKSEYHAGEVVNLAFTLSNIGTEVVMLLSFTRGLFGFAAYDANGNVVATPTLPQKPIMGRRSLIAPPHGRILEPGQSIGAELTWELAKTDSSGRRIPLAPGAYILIGYAWWDRPRISHLQTPPIIVRIIAASP